MVNINYFFEKITCKNGIFLTTKYALDLTKCTKSFDLQATPNYELREKTLRSPWLSQNYLTTKCTKENSQRALSKRFTIPPS